MATSFSANQYEDAFKSKKLANWEEPSEYREDPRPMSGYTKIIANDHGHLVDGVPKSRSNPWGNFVGTWDNPQKIPGNTAQITTARTTYAQEKLKRDSDEANKVLSGNVKNTNRRMMREGSALISKSKPVETMPATERPESGPRSGAEAPGSKMFPYGYSPVPAPERRSVTPAKPATPMSPCYQATNSPIPGVPDIPDVLAMESREPTPQRERPLDGLSAL